MNLIKEPVVSAIHLKYENEKGFVLPVAFIFLVVLGLLGTTAVVVTTTDIKIGGNYKTSEQAFYAAEAGVDEARARLKADAANLINDSHPTQTQWKAYIGSDAKAKGKGYDPINTMHFRTNSLQSDLDYTVIMIHQTDASGNILYWGDADGDGVNERNTTTGENIYLVTCFGSAHGSNKTIEVEMTRLPPITVPSALYVEAATTVQGNSTNVIGIDDCGLDNKPGIVTTQNVGSVTLNGGPTITGVPNNITYNGTNIDIQSIVDSFKESADFAYTVASATHTGTTSPGPGDGWGTPTLGATLQDASSCGSSNIVHYNTGGTFVKLKGGVSGCGILLIEGDLNIDGNFSWYGLVVVTESVVFSGGGNKNITGALLVGGSAIADVIGGNANIVYCSSAIDDQTKNRPLRRLTWKEEM